MNTKPVENIAENLKIARQKIDDAKSLSGVEDVTLVGITKIRSPEQICDLIEAGCSDIGENRMQEWEEKYPQIIEELKKRDFNGTYTRHLVGHLQSNKAKKALQNFDMIQSVDSLKLAQRLSRIADEEKLPPVKCLIQIKLGDEQTKSGIGKFEFERDFEEFVGLKSIRISGFMLIAPLWAMGEAARPYYNEMHEFYQKFKQIQDDRFEMTSLSMGMSADFDVAVSEGANMVRIGRALFDGFETF